VSVVPTDMAALNQVANVNNFGGTTPAPVLSKYPLSLGGITFFTDECPEKFPIGAVEQMIVTHNLPGGSVINQNFGAKPKDVTWTGRFFEPNVEDRVEQLRLYQVSAQEILLSWRHEQYYVYIKDFDPGYMGGYNEYSITVTVTRDANGALAVSNTVTIDQQVSALQQQAIAQNQAIMTIDPVGSAAIQPALAAVQAAITNALPLAVNGASAATVIGAAIVGANSAISEYQASIGESAPQYANTVALGSALTLINTNILRGQSAASATLQGGNLFATAVLAYGDVSQAFPLAAAAGLICPFLTAAAPTTVPLPQLPSTS
jgi:hypothetical protein